MDQAASTPTEPVARRTRQAELRSQFDGSGQDAKRPCRADKTSVGESDVQQSLPVACRTRAAELRRHATRTNDRRSGVTNLTAGAEQVRDHGPNQAVSKCEHPASVGALVRRDDPGIRQRVEPATAARQTRRAAQQRRRRQADRNPVQPSDLGIAMVGENEAPLARQRELKAEQQRRRRALLRDQVSPEQIHRVETESAQKSKRRRATDSSGLEPPPRDLGVAMANQSETLLLKQREVKAEQQRRRRALLRGQESPAERTHRVKAESAQTSERRRATDPSARESRRAHRLTIDQERAVQRRADTAHAVDELSSRILDVASLDADEIAFMSKGQQYTQDPKLALAYYYCCGADPRSFVLGDECVHGNGAEATRQRIHDLFEDYPKADDMASCQKAVAAVNSEQTDVWACASCGHILLCNEDNVVQFRSLDSLRDELVLTQEEKAALMEGVSEAFVRKFRQVFFDGNDVYYLISDLVRDRERIPLCEKCNSGPRESKFSVAAGHDYGRIAELPALSDVGFACITPTRCFGLELSLSGSLGHAIAFPSNGPCEMARVLPSVDLDCMPRVTFVGPLEDWRIQRQKFRSLYAIDVDSVYTWLSVLTKINTVFLDESIVVDSSAERHDRLRQLDAAIEQTVHVSQSKAVSAVHEEASRDQDDDVQDYSGGESGVTVRNSVILQGGVESHGREGHEIVDALIDAVVCDSSLPSLADDTKKVSPTVVAVKRGRHPFVEWLENAKILAGVFPNLFLTGASMLPLGPLSREFVDHFMHYWDGRFEKSAMFSAMLFNQLQRHSAVQKAARVGMTHERSMKKFGKLASTPEFKRALQSAKDHPESPEAIRMNASLLRLLSLVGGCVPFSPFERAATRPKLGAMRYRYGVAQHFVTVAPPEHDDLLLHRVAQLREANGWNDPKHPCLSKRCFFDNLPSSLQSSCDARQEIARRYPALCAQVFERRMTSLTRDIVRCQDSSANRISRNFYERRCGVYGKIAAFNAVIEPQSSGRLHAHLTLYGSSVNPDILTRSACSSELWPQVRKWLAAVSSTHVSSQTREWCSKWKEDHDQKRARAFEIHVPDASIDHDGFLAAAEKQALATNTHSHSHTCRKGKRGEFVCRLARPAGVHDDITQPLRVRLISPSDLGKRRRAEFEVTCLQDGLAAAIDRPRDYSSKRVLRSHMDGAVLWEQTRPETDAMFVETNLGLACLTGSHTNSAVINGKDAGDMVEEYQQSYMTKEKGGLVSGTAVMLTALNDIENYPSLAEDQGTHMRQAKHLATRTVNAFTGGTEWPHALMVYALAGHRSFLSSDTFWYVFPHKLVQALDSSGNAIDDADRQSDSDEETHSSYSGDTDTDNEDGLNDHPSDGTPINVNEALDSIVALANDDLSGQQSRGSSYNGSGARMFRVDDQIVLVTQAQG